MKQTTQARLEKMSRKMSLTASIVLLSVGVLLPVILSTSVGIVALVIGESSQSIVIGVLTVCFTTAAIGGAVSVTVLLSRRARLAGLQANLLANVTHELRTPLTAIRMYAQTLRMGRVAEDREKTDECLDTILRETEWLEAMIDRLLTWRGASNDNELTLTPNPLGDTVKEALERFKRMIDPIEVTLKTKIESNPLVSHDKHAISSAVLNILVNAYKYTSSSNKQITVELVEIDDQVEISIKDNGIGISQAETKKIFDPFYRVDSRLRSKSSGTGLGLAIVRHVIKAHEGKILVTSEEGRGSRFALRLPTAHFSKKTTEE